MFRVVIRLLLYGRVSVGAVGGTWEADGGSGVEDKIGPGDFFAFLRSCLEQQSYYHWLVGDIHIDILTQIHKYINFDRLQ